MEVMFKWTSLVWDCVEQAGRLVTAIRPINRIKNILREVIIRLSSLDIFHHSKGTVLKPVINATLSDEIRPDLSTLLSLQAE